MDSTTTNSTTATDSTLGAKITRFTEQRKCENLQTHKGGTIYKLGYEREFPQHSSSTVGSNAIQRSNSPGIRNDTKFSPLKPSDEIVNPKWWLCQTSHLCYAFNGASYQALPWKSHTSHTTLRLSTSSSLGGKCADRHRTTEGCTLNK